MSTLDLTSWYFPIPMNPEDIAKTDFITKNDCFAAKRMRFSFLEHHQRFKKPRLKFWDLCYVRKFWSVWTMISSWRLVFEEHLKLVREVFTVICNACLSVKLEKCNFLRREIKYLGVKTTQDGIKTDSKKTEANNATPPPPNFKQVSTFLVMVDWFKKYIPHFSELCELL